MDSNSEYSESESEEKLLIENVTPTTSNPFPLEVSLTKYIPLQNFIKLSSIYKNELKLILDHPTCYDIHKLLFWQIFYKKLKPDTTTYLQQKTSKNLSKHYVKILLLNMKTKIDTALECLPLVLGHAIHHELYELFKFSRYFFDMRFILDCYKIIYLELLGLTVTDSFILASAKKLFGDYFMKYARKVKKNTEVVKTIVDEKYEKQMESIPGGIEFAKELAGKLRPVTSKIELKINEEQIKLAVSDSIIADRVQRHLSEPILKKSIIEDNNKTFNCNKLSPLLSRQIQSSTVRYI